METQLVVLGGGPGGYSAAFRAADLGLQVTLVEQEGRLGGVCLQRGCIPSKALLHAARVVAEVTEMAEWGIRYEQPPAIDVDALRGRKDKIVQTLTGGLGQLAKKRGVRVLQARAKFAASDRLRLEATGDGEVPEELRFEHCILATGSRPARPGALDLPGGRVMDSTGALELPDVPGRLLVIGGGYIGLELGTVYARLGSQVTVVEILDGLLPGADRDLVRPLHKRLEGLLASIRLKTKVARMEERGDRIAVTFEGEQAGEEEFDRVLLSVGRRPNVEEIGLENTRVELTDAGFVKVDERMRTTDEKILAIGDVAGEPMLAHKGMHEGKVAAEVLAGEASVFDARAIPAVVFTDPEIAWAGLTQTQAEAREIPFELAVYPWGASGRAQSLARPEGLTKMLLEPQTGRVLGVGIVGVNAGDLISEAVLAIEMGCEARDIADSIHPHPTLGETVGGASEVYFGLATEVYKPRRPR